MREVKLPDGKTAQFPKDTPDEILHSFAKDYIDNNLGNQQKEQQTQSETQPISRGEAALTTLTNAVPFAPRIKAGIATGVAKLAGVEDSAKDLYNEAVQNELTKLGQAREQYPAQSLTTEIARGVLAAPALPFSAGMAGAAGMGALQSIGESKDLTDIGDVATQGLGGGLISAGSYGLLKSLGKGYEKYIGAPKVQKMTADEVKQMAGQAYKTADEKGGILKEQFINNLTQKTKELDKQTEIGKAISGNTAINEIGKTLSKFKDQKLNLQGLQELDEALGDKIDNFVENGRITKEGLPLLKLQQHLRNLVEEVNPNMVEGNKEGFEALKQGRQLWAKSAKLRDIEKIITRAEMSDNPATAIKSGFRTLFNNDNKLKYFNEGERKLIKNAAQSGIISDSFRTLGSRLIPIGSIVAGGGLPSAMAGMASSTASRGIASKMQLAKAEKIAEAIIAGKIPMPKNQDSLLKSIIAQKIGATSIYQQPQQQE